MMKPINLLILLALAGCTQTVAETRRADERQSRNEAKLARALSGLTPGQPTTCLSSVDRRIARVESIGGTQVFRIGRDRVFVNRMNGNCTTSAIDPIFVTQTPTTALCSGDIAQLIDRASQFPIGACSYGEFVPYMRSK